MKKVSLKIILPVVIMLPPLIRFIYFSVFAHCNSSGFPSECTLSVLALPLVIMYYFGLGLVLALFVVSFYFFNKKIKSVAVMTLLAGIFSSLFYLGPLLALVIAPVYNYIKGPEIIKVNNRNIPIIVRENVPTIVSDKFNSLMARNRTISLNYCNNKDQENFFVIERKIKKTSSIEEYYYDNDGNLTNKKECASRLEKLHYTTERRGTNAIERDFMGLLNILMDLFNT